MLINTTIIIKYYFILLVHFKYELCNVIRAEVCKSRYTLHEDHSECIYQINLARSIDILLCDHHG